MSETEFENEDYGLTEDQLALLETTDIPDGQIDYSKGDNQEESSDGQPDSDEPEQPEGDTKEPDEEEEKKSEPSEEKVDDRKVPLSALHQEREQRRQWRDRANELQGQLNLIMQSLQSGGGSFNQNQGNDKKEPEPVYDPKTHPLEYIQQQMSQFQESKRQFDEFNRAQAQAIQQKQIEEQVVNTWSRAVEEQKLETPDVEDATKYLIETRSNQLRAFGMAPAQIEKQLRSEVIQLVSQGQQRGINPAKMAFDMAMASGYRANTNTPAPVQESKVKEASNQIKNAEKARKATRTLAAVSGSPASDDMTLEVLDQMSEREFSRWIEKHPRQYEKLLMTSM